MSQEPAEAMPSPPLEDPQWDLAFEALLYFVHDQCAQQGGGVWTTVPLLPLLNRVAGAREAGNWSAFQEAMDDVRHVLTEPMFPTA